MNLVLMLNINESVHLSYIKIIILRFLISTVHENCCT